MNWRNVHLNGDENSNSKREGAFKVRNLPIQCTASMIGMKFRRAANKMLAEERSEGCEDLSIESFCTRGKQPACAPSGMRKRVVLQIIVPMLLT